MQYTAKWGPKGFLISSTKIVPLMDLTSTVSVKTETQNDTSGTSKTNVKGRELQPITLSTMYLRAAGVDPRAQVEEWEALVGKAYPLIVGNKRFGPAKLMLKSVSSADIITDNFGKFLQAKVSLSFEEYSDKAATSVSTSSRSSSSDSASRASTVFTETVAKKKAEKEPAASSTPAKTAAKTTAKKKALQTGATKSDKATKKSRRGALNEIERKLTT